jgi:hypothetical protein
MSMCNSSCSKGGNDTIRLEDLEEELRLKNIMISVLNLQIDDFQEVSFFLEIRFQKLRESSYVQVQNLKQVNLLLTYLTNNFRR